MKKFSVSSALLVFLVGMAAISAPARAETGRVAVIFTKGGFVVGVGGGEGVLTLRGSSLSIHCLGHECRLYDRSLDDQACWTSP